MIIALPTYLSGCEINIAPHCIRYYITETTIISHYVDVKQCNYCLTSQTTCTEPNRCTTRCVLYHFYPCYDSYAVAEFYGNNTCSIKVSINSLSYYDALTAAENRYIKGHSYSMYIDKSTTSCSTESEVVTLAIVGLVFFILTGVVLCIIYVLYCAKPCFSAIITPPPEYSV